MTHFLFNLLPAIVAAILAITLHEAAHGYAALAMGDDTAKLAGRLSLNPLRHVDRVGSILLPGALLIGQLVLIGRVAFMFGWARPVPVSAYKFRNPRRGMAVVAAAGPAMNFVLAWLAVLALPRVQVPLGSGIGPIDAAIGAHPLLGLFLFYFILSNLVLGLFNLLPIPPLDGGRIVVGLLPLAAARAWARLERLGILIVVLVVFVLPQIFPGFNPVGALLDRVLPAMLNLLLWLGFHASPGGGNVQYL